MTEATADIAARIRSEHAQNQSLDRQGHAGQRLGAAVARRGPGCGKQVLLGTHKGQMSDLYVPRIVDGLLDMLLCSFPAISLVGSRSARKTITAARHGTAR